MTYLNRGAKVKIVSEAEGVYIYDSNDSLLLSPYQNYSIYLRNVKFVDNEIHGRYLGNSTDLVDEYSRPIEFRQGNWYLTTHNEIVVNAKLIVVSNTIEFGNSIIIVN